MTEQAASTRESAMAARSAAREKIGEYLPNKTQEIPSADPSSCGGWFAAAELCYQQATTAPDINTAIEWYLKCDAYDTVGEACVALQSTL
jgi:hypothetical protein